MNDMLVYLLAYSITVRSSAALGCQVVPTPEPPLACQDEPILSSSYPRKLGNVGPRRRARSTAARSCVADHLCQRGAETWQSGQADTRPLGDTTKAQGAAESCTLL